jgi:LDH2 family malate/lactate/ureidoglycolate dehydrogenase
MEVGVVHVSIDEAERMTAAALRAIGWDADDAALQAEIMTAAELCGNNQGLVKMYQPHLMAPSPDYAGKPIVTRETASSAVIDARQSPGMLAAVTAADLVVQKLEPTDSNTAPPTTIAIVCTHNSSTSSGQLAFYVERMARRGIIGLALCNSPEFVAAAPRAKPVFGTNPLAVSVPVSDSDYPFTVSLFDRCVCVCVYGKCFF